MPYPQSRSSSPQWRSSSPQSFDSGLVKVPYGGLSSSFVPATGSSESSPRLLPQYEQSRPSTRDGSRPSSRARPVIPARDVPLSALNASSDKPVTRGQAIVGPGRDNREWTQSSSWIANPGTTREPYDLGPLLKGDIVSELWFEEGDTLVYLFPKNAQKGPSFRIRSEILTASPSLMLLLRGDHQNDFENHRRSFDISELDNRIETMALADDNHPRPQTAVVNDLLVLYLPIPFAGNANSSSQVLQNYDIELLIAYRNLFALLVDTPLVGTMRDYTLFSVLREVSKLLQRYGFTDEQGISYGQPATRSFDRFCLRHKIGDVRHSREKSIENIILADQMRSPLLYNEAFTHTVGKLESIKSLRLPLWNHVRPVIRSRLERAHHDLERKLIVVRGRFVDFDFPSVFTGIAKSTSALQYKMVDFKAWKSAFFAFQKFTISNYRKTYGNWPPKPDTEPLHDFADSGLNRLVLKEIHQDFADLYDVLVDRTSITPRPDVHPLPLDADENPAFHALRRIMDEFDRNSPPIVPAIPFDLPRLPDLGTLRGGPRSTDASLKKAQINEILLQSYNRASMKLTAFISQFLDFEREEGRGKSTKELIDNRFGQWLFVYVVLQSLPIVTTDVEGLSYTSGVEYFLCEQASTAFPWMKNDRATSRSWYDSATGKIVSLPAGSPNSSVDNAYQRSHCWKQARLWAAESGIPSPVLNKHFPRTDTIPDPPPKDHDYKPGQNSPQFDFSSFEALANSGLPPMTLKPLPNPTSSRSVSPYDRHRSQAAPPPPYRRHYDSSDSSMDTSRPPVRSSTLMPPAAVPNRRYDREGGDGAGQTFDHILGCGSSQSEREEVKSSKKRERGKLRKSFGG